MAQTKSRTRRVKLKDFFVSYTEEDQTFAKWIAENLEDVGYTTIIQAWDFGTGDNFVERMNRALERCRRTLMVMSTDYFKSVFATAEWQAAFAHDPKSLFPVRVRPCEPPRLLQATVYCDLVDLADDEARARLLVNAQRLDAPGGRLRPRHSPFPQRGTSKESGRDLRCSRVRKLIEVLDTTRATFVAQCQVRNKLVEAMRRHLEVSKPMEYEEFFARYYSKMNAEERRQHAAIRGYTKQVLKDYNEQALNLAQHLSPLDDDIQSLSMLRRHLRLWGSKYKSNFVATPSACLVYVGVDEEAGFPRAVEDELREYRHLHCGGRPVKGGRTRQRSHKGGESAGVDERE